MEYEYDSNGRKIRQVQKQKESDADTSAYYVTTFNYDTRDMLTEEKYLRWDNSNSVWLVMYWGRYSYDIGGNMAQRIVYQIVNGNSKSYADTFTYSRGYELTSFARGTPAVGQGEVRTFTLTYDSNGNMTHIQQNQAFTDSFYDITEMEFDYDAKNRLVKYRFGGAGSWYEIDYDALGRVRARIDLSPTTTKYYSDGRQLIQQLDNSNNVQFDYLRGATGLERQWNESNDTRRFYIKDNLGTVWAIVNPSDLSVKRYNYNAWGEHLDKDDTDFPTDTNWMRYIGCRVEAFGKGTTTQRDAIYHVDHRHYSAVVSFLSRDPLGFMGDLIGNDDNVESACTIPLNPFGRFPSPNSDLTSESITEGNTSTILKPYQYSDNQPTNWSDPSGLLCCERTGYWVSETFILWRQSKNPARFCVWKCWHKIIIIRKKVRGCWGLETRNNGYDSYERDDKVQQAWLSAYYPGLVIYKLSGWGKVTKEYYFASYGWRNITFEKVECHFEHNIYPDYRFAPPSYCIGEGWPGLGEAAIFEVSYNKPCDKV